MKVIFISLDTLRADRLTVFGGERGLTPHLDRIAAEGAAFSRTFASDIPTQPSHTALFTGQYGVHTDIVSHFHPAPQLAPDVAVAADHLPRGGLRHRGRRPPLRR